MKIQQLFKWASTTFSLIPGLVVIMTNIGVPPAISGVLMGGVIEALGALTLILLRKNKKYINSLAISRLNRITIVCICCFFISFILYVFLSGSQIIHSVEFEREFFFPFWYGKDLADMVAIAGSKLNAVHSFGPSAVDDAIKNSSPFPELTLVIFMLIYTFVFQSLVLAFGLQGYRDIRG